MNNKYRNRKYSQGRGVPFTHRTLTRAFGVLLHQDELLVAELELGAVPL